MGKATGKRTQPHARSAVNKPLKGMPESRHYQKNDQTKIKKIESSAEADVEVVAVMLAAKKEKG